MRNDQLFSGAGAARPRRQSETPISPSRRQEALAAASSVPSGPLDLEALAATLIRLAEIAEAREARLREMLGEAAAQGDLKRVRQLARRLGTADSSGSHRADRDSRSDSENPRSA